MYYESDKGYFYKIIGGKANRTKNPKRYHPKPKIGNVVKIIIKPYKKIIIREGRVKNVLTKKKRHSRGHKVCLDNGLIGRIIYNNN